MKAFSCRVCGRPLFFENSICVSCGTALAYSREEAAIVPLDASGGYLDPDGRTWFGCRNLNLSGCTWLAAEPGGQCFSCDLTRTRPNDADLAGLENFLRAERAKRHLIAELDRLGFPIVGKNLAAGGDPDNGLCFDLLSSVIEPVVTGHENGVITLDLAEGDPVHRERVRVELAEPYRTMLGHFRHEVGHYYQWQLVERTDRLLECRRLFGDERTDYPAAIQRHYEDGPPPDWPASHISTYATMHPYEDFAETWAHFLHICDAIETAGEYGLAPRGLLDSEPSFRELVTGVWVPLSGALNMMNRSIGARDLYPFVLAPPVLDKLEFVASLRPAATG
ncbi:MAG: putative zinc-binding metallopeptidase [Propionicimonas sp.]|nr:putative zinc-binding metallopeptidase [Propionicimonas sp.]